MTHHHIAVDSIGGGSKPRQWAGPRIHALTARTQKGEVCARTLRTEYINIYIAQVYMLFTVYIDLYQHKTQVFIGAYNRQS